jgi:hypothetical protein
MRNETCSDDSNVISQNDVLLGEREGMLEGTPCTTTSSDINNPPSSLFIPSSFEPLDNHSSFNTFSSSSFEPLDNHSSLFNTSSSSSSFSFEPLSFVGGDVLDVPSGTRVGGEDGTISFVKEKRKREGKQEDKKEERKEDSIDAEIKNEKKKKRKKRNKNVRRGVNEEKIDKKLPKNKTNQDFMDQKKISKVEEKKAPFSFHSVDLSPIKLSVTPAVNNNSKSSSHNIFATSSALQSQVLNKPNKETPEQKSEEENVTKEKKVDQKPQNISNKKINNAKVNNKNKLGNAGSDPSVRFGFIYEAAKQREVGEKRGKPLIETLLRKNKRFRR